jgi:cyclohexyl-isocyanide hydratase
METLNVGFLLYPGCTLMDFAGAVQVFSSAVGKFKTFIVSEEKAITTTEGLTVLADYSLELYPAIDILFIPGGGDQGVIAAMNNSKVLDFINTVSPKCQWRGSVCTGAFILAASGILKNCKATTYWSVLPVMARLSDKLNLEISQNSYPRYLIDIQSKLFTGGGISSSLDLALELVKVICGTTVAEETQLFIQYQPNPPVNSGDPAHAPANILAAVSEMEQGFIDAITKAVDALLVEE